MRQHTHIALDRRRRRQAIGGIDPCALGKSKQNDQQKKCADLSLGRVDQPPAAQRQQRSTRGRRDHRHHVDGDHDTGNLGARGRFDETDRE